MMTRIRKPDFRYLTSYKTLDEAKDLYKKKATVLHPDRGGNVSDMQQLNSEWDYIKRTNYIPSQFQPTAKTFTPPVYRPKPVSKVVLEYEMATFIIDSLVTETTTAGKNVSATYFNFVDFITTNNYKTTRKQLDYLAIKLKYNSGWAYYKEQELKQKGLI
jgi:hypothetical protein